MRNFYFVWFGGFIYLATVAIGVFFYFEANRYRELLVSQAIIDVADRAASNAALDNVKVAREQAKIDGKIEAILMFNNLEMNTNPEDKDSILTFMENKTKDDLEKSPQFLNLLSQAAFHKGLHTGREESEKQKNEQYQEGYHKAIEDLTCPETGKMVVPNITKPK
jgi:isochorismate synthase EntC